MLLATLLTLGLMATSALAQVSGDPVPDCPVGNCAGQGQSVPGGDIGGGGDADEPPDDVDIPGGAGGGANTAPGPNGAAGTGSRDGVDGADQFGGSPRDQGQPGRPGAGQPGRSGNPSPTPAVGTSPGGRTIPSYAPPRPGSRTTSASAQQTQTSGSALLPFDVIASPFPTLEPSPSPSPSPSPTDLVAAIEDFDPEPVAEDGGSLLPLMAVLAGAALLFAYFRVRKRSMRASRISSARFR